MSRGRLAGTSRWGSDRRAEAAVGFALVLPLLLLVLVSILGVARVTGAVLGVSAAAREAARVGSLQADAADARAQGTLRGQQVAADYGLPGTSVQVDTSSFGPQGEVRATAAYTLVLADVPYLHLGRVQLVRSHAEVVGPWRSLN
jgi:Flp pilus assembly protein TadG